MNKDKNTNIADEATTYEVAVKDVKHGYYIDFLKLLAKHDYLQFWRSVAQSKLKWHKPFTQTLNASKAPFYRWFEDGEINVSANCLDVHLPHNANKVAIIGVNDNGVARKVTYGELHEQVCKLANGLRTLGVTKGDRVVIYMPHSIEGVIAMQACARIGAIHSVVFGGFSPKSLSERIMDAMAKVIISADFTMRGGKKIMLLDNVNEALGIITNSNHAKSDSNKTQTHAQLKSNLPQAVVVFRQGEHNDAAASAINGLAGIEYVSWQELLANSSPNCEAVAVGSCHPLFILYTSGSTAKPKGIVHSSGGYLTGVAYTMKVVFNLKENDIFWCTADIGWITGHSYVCYGALLAGVTQIIFEGVPTFPDAATYWSLIEQHKVTVFYTAPTVIRTLIKLDSELPKKYDLSTLRLLGSVGEPINPEAWRWYYEVVGGSRCSIIDTWWQTETGAHVLSPIPNVSNMKAGSCNGPLPGIYTDIINRNQDGIGYLVLTKPIPSLLLGVWQNSDTYINTYYPQEIADGKFYVSGDLAYCDKDGYYWIMGRSDDVINVSGHRLSTMEVESVIALHQEVAEVAVVARHDSVKGEALVAFVVCKNIAKDNAKNDHENNELLASITGLVTKEISIIAKPDCICLVNALPKTRSGKIMRRLLKAIANHEPIKQDISTLDDPSIVASIIESYE